MQKCWFCRAIKSADFIVQIEHVLISTIKSANFLDIGELRRLWRRLKRYLWTDLYQIWHIAFLHYTEKKIFEQFDSK